MTPGTPGRYFLAEKLRPAVVLDEYPAGVLHVAIGTTRKPATRPGVAFDALQPNQPDGYKLGLAAPTYFYEGCLAVIPAAEFQRQPGTNVCSEPLVVRLKMLLQL